MDRQQGGGVDPNTGLLVQGDPQGGVAGTKLHADFMNGLTEEMRNAIVFAGLTPDPNDWDQLRKAMAFIAAQRPALANLIFNGGMRLWRRGDAHSNVDHIGQYTADRWLCRADGVLGAGIAQITQRPVGLDGNPPDGLRDEMFWNQTVAAAVAPPILRYRMEDVRLTAGQKVTISWWQRLPTGTFPVSLKVTQEPNPGGIAPVQVGTQTTDVLPSTTDWTRQSFTFDVPALAGASIGFRSYLEFEWALPSGSPFSFQISNVQAEYGDVATPFQTRPEVIERQLCERYYQTSYPTGVEPGTPIAPGSNQALNSLGDAQGLQQRFAVEMRSPPTMKWFGPSSGTVGRVGVGSTEDGVTGTAGVSTVVTGYPTLQGSHVNPINMLAHFTADAEL